MTGKYDGRDAMSLAEELELMDERLVEVERQRNSAEEDSLALRKRVMDAERELAEARGLVAECLALNPIVSGDEVRVWSDVTKRMTWSDVTKRMTAFAGDPGSEWKTGIAELEQSRADLRTFAAAHSESADRAWTENARLERELAEAQKQAEWIQRNITDRQNREIQETQKECDRLRAALDRADSDLEKYCHQLQDRVLTKEGFFFTMTHTHARIKQALAGGEGE